jgi:2,4-diaminopentanoate dehydrogenase
MDSKVENLKKPKVICFGLGPIGISIAKLALSRADSLEIVGAVDVSPSIAGKDLGQILGSGGVTGIKVVSSGKDLYANADVVLHATSSFLSTAESQLMEFCDGAVDVVSTCEELSYPWLYHKEAGERLDRAAKKNNVTLLGTGVNPGFVLDALAITLSGVCASIGQIRATRILDATKRRIPFQRKVGIGLRVEEFEENVRTGKFGHIGLPESIAMTCEALGKTVDKVEQKISPKLADVPVPTENWGLVEKGKVIGLIQDGSGFSNNTKIAEYHIEMYAGAKDARDEIEFLGNPNIKLIIPGGTPGDIATAAIIVNSIPRVIDSPPGLLTVKDVRPAAGILS